MGDQRLVLPELEDGTLDPAAATGQEELASPEVDADGLAAAAAPDGEGEATDSAPPLQQLQGEFRRLVAPLAAFAKLKPADPRVLERLDAALKRLPPGETLGRELDGLRERTDRYLQGARRERIAAFRPIEVEFVRAAREAGKALRERANGWRVDMLELQLQREQARARFFYNRESLTPWSPIGAADDLAALEARARGLLERAAWPDEMLAEVFRDAYEGARARRGGTGGRGSRSEAVPIPDFYREVRVALVRRELAREQPDKKLRWGELPRWAFLYNLDRYRALGASAPGASRLGLQTGSQQESRTIGMVVNGLDAHQDYKTMCFIVPVGAGDARGTA